jgi:hypothetical protein
MEEFFKNTIQPGAKVRVGDRDLRLIESQSTPKKLFKYRSINEFTRKLLTAREVYHAGKDSFNDPLDGINSYRLVYTSEDMSTYLNYISEGRPEDEAAMVRTHFLQNPDQFEDMARNNIMADIGPLGVSCFSAKNDNFLMWSHYAEEHRGLCLEFDFSREIPMMLQQGFLMINSYMLNMRKVVYTDSTAIVNLQSVCRDRFSPVYYKSKHWEYEQEYRSVRPAVGVFPFDPTFLQAVYFGMRATTNDMDDIRNLIGHSGYRGISFKKMARKSSDSYDLISTDL